DGAFRVRYSRLGARVGGFLLAGEENEEQEKRDDGRPAAHGHLQVTFSKSSVERGTRRVNMRAPPSTHLRPGPSCVKSMRLEARVLNRIEAQWPAYLPFAILKRRSTVRQE